MYPQLDGAKLNRDGDETDEQVGLTSIDHQGHQSDGDDAESKTDSAVDETGKRAINATMIRAGINHPVIA
tara:strand:- start:11937 stop:12146 length:210 start_codon:yes stop_codon:yes gene_type:complete